MKIDTCDKHGNLNFQYLHSYVYIIRSQQLQYTPWNWNMSKFYEVADFKNSDWGNIALFKKVYITSQKNNIQSTAGFM